ncbi:chaperone, PapD family [Escherichia coli]|nr:chaperone, PapD family [Escherichia coli]STF78400.1 chaperone, PapD family [Escherichia coli]
MTFMKGLPLLLLVASLCSHAALQPDRTRIVFNANDKATSLRVDNRSDKLPYLAYSWLENEKGEKSDDLLVAGNDSNLLIVFYVQIMPDDFVMQLHRF